jgi:hypothetical protein
MLQCPIIFHQSMYNLQCAHAVNTIFAVTFQWRQSAAKFKTLKFNVNKCVERLKEHSVVKQEQRNILKIDQKCQTLIKQEPKWNTWNRLLKTVAGYMRRYHIRNQTIRQNSLTPSELVTQHGKNVNKLYHLPLHLKWLQRHNTFIHFLTPVCITVSIYGQLFF